MTPDFITWWFDTHPIWSTILTPSLTFIWCIYKGLFWRGVVAFLLAGGITIGTHHRR